MTDDRKREITEEIKTNSNQQKGWLRRRPALLISGSLHRKIPHQKIVKLPSII
jgi:hypothetical protein